MNGFTCAVDVRVETVLVRFCCSGAEVGDGPCPVDGVGGEVELCDAAVIGASRSRDDGADVVDVEEVGQSFEGGCQFVCHSISSLLDRRVRLRTLIRQELSSPNRQGRLSFIGTDCGFIGLRGFDLSCRFRFRCRPRRSERGSGVYLGE